MLPEREARAIIAQVFSGLAHLNRADGGAEPCGPRVIHYDLKPANILFDKLGTVKITDFGLSKVCARVFVASCAAIAARPLPTSGSSCQAHGPVQEARRRERASGSMYFALLSLSHAPEGSGSHQKTVLLKPLKGVQLCVECMMQLHHCPGLQWLLYNLYDTLRACSLRLPSKCREPKCLEKTDVQLVSMHP